MAKFEEKSKSITPSDFANICYTSGTTADPKGIILTHGNYVTNVYQAYSLMDIPPFYKTLLILLPWDHSFGTYVRYICIHGQGCKHCFCRSQAKHQWRLSEISQSCLKEIKPNLLMSVPAIAKNFRKNIEKGYQGKGKTHGNAF